MVFCTDCGAKCGASDKFCTDCGFKFTGATSSPSPASTTSQPASTPPPSSGKPNANFTVKLGVRGSASAPKMSQITVKVDVENKGGASEAPISFRLKNIITGDWLVAKNTKSMSVAAGGASQNFNLGDFFDTPKTGSYMMNAIVDGSVSNELNVKMLL